MFSMRRSFRKPLILGFFFCLFLFVLPDHDDEYDIQEDSQSDQDDRYNVKTPSLGEVERHDQVEDIVFAQGVLVPRTGDRLSHLQQDRKDVYGEGFKDLSGIKAQEGELRKDLDDQNGVSQDYPLRDTNSITQSINGSYGLPYGPASEHRFADTGETNEKQPLWMRVSDDIYTYSGFWDDRQELPEGPVARILGVLKFGKQLLREDSAFKWNGNVNEDKLNCSCLLWYENKEAQKGNLKAFFFEEGRELYAGTFFLCYPPQDNRTIEQLDNESSNTYKHLSPYAVSLLPDDTVNAPHKLIYLTHRPQVNIGNEGNRSTGVCVRALFGPYKDLKGMVQFVAYYATVLKVSHFYFYNLAVEPKIIKFLSRLKTLGLTFDILPWNIPTSEWGELWDIGSLTALNDCVYRSSGKHSHMAVVDLDEFIVPRTPVKNLGDIYEKVLSFRKGKHGDAVLVPNVFYCTDFPEKNIKDKNNSSFPIFRYTQREGHLWPPKSRSKFIVLPENIVSVGHHMVHNFLPQTLDNRSSPKLLSILHHYRVCKDIRLGMSGKGSKIFNKEIIKDSAMLRYKSAVMNSKVMMLYKKYSASLS